MKIVVRGRQASRSEAPILVVAPHSTFIDGGIVYILGFPSTIVRRESGLNPFTGKLINYTQPVYVWRDDPNSRQNTIKEIIERATSKEDWPQIMIFPEGTCTNRSCLITFKCGAFYPGVPVQPVCIRYPNKLDTVTWTWEGPGAALEIPVSDYTYDDCRIINKAHMLHLPHAAGIVEAHKLRCKLGLQKVKIEEELVQKRLVNIEETVNFNEFARILRLDAKDPSVQQLFRIHDRANKGTIDIEEYMFTVLAIANANSVLDLVNIAFDVCDANGTKCLDTKKLRKALKLSLQLEPEESDRIFSQACHDVSGGEAVSFEDVITVLGTRTEFSHIFADDNEGRRKKTI
ncbi:hypothetical protein G9C98_002144 [Cotesia typhae]|uniref:EF-hand domain-containing protein n=1 Tax=Cotesia typhae TaxID=2053667 RepID=A0A8J5QY37_9HYME|nr:hypothetical protein G9C98_002144 [Cotesia typhae]